MPTITFKVSDDEARRLRSKAKRSRLSLSEFVRRRVSDTRNKKKPPLLKRCPLTGVQIFHGTPDMIPLTTGTVREMLADFP